MADRPGHHVAVTVQVSVALSGCAQHAGDVARHGRLFSQYGYAAGFGSRRHRRAPRLRRFWSWAFKWPREANWPANSAVRGVDSLGGGSKSRRRNRSDAAITAVPIDRKSVV